MQKVFKAIIRLGLWYSYTNPNGNNIDKKLFYPRNKNTNSSQKTSEFIDLAGIIKKLENGFTS
jgi:hypothetical protein